MQVKAIIKKIGAKAISVKDPMVILFGEEATDVIENVSVVQKFIDKKQQVDLNPQVGDTIEIDGQTFKIEKVGQLVQDNLSTIGHVTLIFKHPSDEDQMQNAIYLANQNNTFPKFTVGAEILYNN
ncbi:PTS glucitol/sorbitol transporter subunit IIA [Agrilactobacillus fermenti]|uniref:PTS glucitol/sorbitol transporter subunit IIA n=1 Tax=Agrilactobacillus fermenti TaxID=2586909 RepID=UPI001E64C023|nr:PTS glucitol/sorbitol transporter subunit IIA [Agrilactobacillus fermenti]MCD2257276.1 PTS glucitol/sorbitol transporter subunit IIA [Agrilactobacillus fermenti]